MFKKPHSGIATLLLSLLSPCMALAAPIITDVIPAQISTQGGEQVTIHGSGLDDSDPPLGNDDPVVTLAGQPLTVIQASPSQITFISPAGQGSNLQLRVALDDEEDVTTISYQPPLISNATGSPATAGGQITINGSNFGLEAGGSITVGGSGSAIVNSWSHNSITATVPPGEGTGVSVVVSAGGQASNPGSFSYAPPVVSNIPTAARPTAGNVPITITGSNFGLTAGVTIGGATANVVLQTHSFITCDLPAGQGSSNDLVVTVAGQQSTPTPFAYDPPVITSMTPTQGLSTQPTTITINGENFGTAPIVNFGSATATLSSASHSQITCVRPTGEVGSLDVSVLAGDQQSPPMTFNSILLTSPPGYYIDTATLTVVPAPPGKIAPFPDMISPIDPDPGTYAPIEGMRASIPASPGHYVPDAGAADQLPTPIGKVAPSPGMTTPIDPTPGYYAPLEGMRSAIPASPGYFVPDTGAAAQLPAPVGQFVSWPGSEAASFAPAGSYAPIEGMRAAIPAPEGTYAPTSGSSSVLPVPPGMTVSDSDPSLLEPLPQIQIVAYELLPNGDHSLEFETDASQNYGIFYSENLVDFTMVQTEPGTGSTVSITITPPLSSTGRRFWVVAPVELP